MPPTSSRKEPTFVDGFAGVSLTCKSPPNDECLVEEVEAAERYSSLGLLSRASCWSRRLQDQDSLFVCARPSTPQCTASMPMTAQIAPLYYCYLL